MIAVPDNLHALADAFRATIRELHPDRHSAFEITSGRGRPPLTCSVVCWDDLSSDGAWAFAAATFQRFMSAAGASPDMLAASNGPAPPTPWLAAWIGAGVAQLQDPRVLPLLAGVELAYAEAMIEAAGR